MLANVNLEKVLVFDIETVPASMDYSTLDTEIKNAWVRKCEYLIKDDSSPEQFFYERAGIYAEFGKVICISGGYFIKKENEDGYNFRVRSWYGDDEALILADFAKMMLSHFNDRDIHRLIGHNSMEFDIPYLCRRMVVNEQKLPALFDLHGAKPWEVQHLDTMQLWKFGDRKSYTSLDLLASILGIPSSKGDINGADVARVYYEESGLDRIKEYCQRDVVATARVLMKYMRLPLLKDEDVKIATES